MEHVLGKLNLKNLASLFAHVAEFVLPIRLIAVTAFEEV